jgi:hypothetical protein
VTAEQQPPLQPAAAPKKGFPTPLQAVLLTIAGFAMMFFGCLGAIASYDASQILFGILLVTAIAGLLGFLVGLGSVLYLFVKGVVKAFKDSSQKTPPPPPPADPPSAATTSSPAE